MARPNGSATMVATIAMRSESSIAVHSSGVRPNMGLGAASGCYPPAHASRACPTCALLSAKPGQARVSWRGGPSGAAKLRSEGWGAYACSELAVSAQRQLGASGAPHLPPLPATRCAHEGRGAGRSKRRGHAHDAGLIRTVKPYFSKIVLAVELRRKAR